jgi:hypothetical protein
MRLKKLFIPGKWNTMKSGLTDHSEDYLPEMILNAGYIKSSRIDKRTAVRTESNEFSRVKKTYCCNKILTHVE